MVWPASIRSANFSSMPRSPSTPASACSVNVSRRSALLCAEAAAIHLMNENNNSNEVMTSRVGSTVFSFLGRGENTHP